MSPTTSLVRAAARDDGSAVVEFVLVGTLLTLLTLSVLQLGLALLVRNTVLDAASEGARYAALADNDLPDGVARTRDLCACRSYPGSASADSEETQLTLRCLYVNFRKSMLSGSKN